MDKVKQKLLEDLTKANKSRKLLLAKRYGFNTVEEYKEYLEKDFDFPKPNIQFIKPKPTIHNVVLLDATGSMAGSKYNNSAIGIQKELEWLKTQTDVNYTASVVEFIQKDYASDVVNINNHGMFLSPSNLVLKFKSAYGCNTPLYKAVLDIITNIKTKALDTDKVLLKVYTDGENNRLEEYKTECKRVIQEVQKKNFTVTFVGTKRDLDKIIYDLDLEESNCLAIEDSGEGFETAFKMSMASTQCYTKSVLKGKDVSTGFYKKIIN